MSNAKDLMTTLKKKVRIHSRKLASISSLGIKISLIVWGCGLCWVGKIDYQGNIFPCDCDTSELLSIKRF